MSPTSRIGQVRRVVGRLQKEDHPDLMGRSGRVRGLRGEEDNIRLVPVLAVLHDLTVRHQALVVQERHLACLRASGVSGG